jgi:hypothetical protein
MFRTQRKKAQHHPQLVAAAAQPRAQDVAIASLAPVRRSLPSLFLHPIAASMALRRLSRRKRRGMPTFLGKVIVCFAGKRWETSTSFPGTI